MRNSRLRNAIVGLVILLYLLPILLLNILPVFYSGHGLLLFSLGFLTISLGSGFMIIKLCQWEEDFLKKLEQFADVPFTYNPQTPVAETLDTDKDQTQSLNEAMKQIVESNQELESKVQEKEKILFQEVKEKKNLLNQIAMIQEEFQLFKETSCVQINQKEEQIRDCQQTISDFRSSMEKKQQQIAKLENSIHELTYEIKTLLQLNDHEETKSTSFQNDSQKNKMPLRKEAPSLRKEVEPLAIQTTLPFVEKKTPSQRNASAQLKRCIDIAQKMTGAGHISISSTFRDVPIDSYALDQRRLFDNLRAESAFCIYVYSQREDKLLFVNQAAKAMFGWSPEKFTQDFSQLIQEGYEDWKKAVSSLAMTREAQLPVVVKTRSGQDRFVQCQMGIVPTGVFKNHIIGILFE